MSFGRQWFPPIYSVGMGTQARQFADKLNYLKFKDALQILEEEYMSCPFYWGRQKARLQRLRDRVQGRTRTSNIVKVHFYGFWPNMNPEDCQIMDMLRSAAPELLFYNTRDMDDADIQIVSCYGELGHVIGKESSSDRWLFLGENVRPEYYNFDYSLTFDINEYGGRNTYMPLWLLEIDWFGKQYQDRKTAKAASITDYRLIDYSRRRNSIVFIGNNAEPYREFVINSLIEEGLDVVRYGSHTNPVDDKIDVLSKFKAAICFENSFYPGYLTEKLIHCHISGVHCLYWGGGSPGVNTDAGHILCTATGDDKGKVKEFLDRAFTYEENVCISPIVQRSFLYSEYGRICGSLRNMVRPYILSLNN